jgi:hypothetical protein
MIKLRDDASLLVWVSHSRYTKKHVIYDDCTVTLCGRHLPKYAYKTIVEPYDTSDYYCSVCIKVARKERLIEGEFDPDDA